MAGGGVKPGFTYGKTDEMSYNIVENLCTFDDLHAVSSCASLASTTKNLAFK